MSYQDTLQQLQENLHIERQLETYPSWIGWTLVVFGIILVLSIMNHFSEYLMLGYSQPERTDSIFSTIWHILVSISAIGTLVVGAIGLIVAIPYTNINNESEQQITTYLSQMNSDEYARFKQQVEINRNTSFDDPTLQATHKYLKNTLTPESKNIFFFVHH